MLAMGEKFENRVRRLRGPQVYKYPLVHYQLCGRKNRIVSFFRGSWTFYTGMVRKCYRVGSDPHNCGGQIRPRCAQKNM